MPLDRRIVKRFLRSPKVIIGEIVAVAFAGVFGATLPQAGNSSAAELARLHARGPIVARVVDLLELDHVFRSYWFLALTLLASASLSIVVAEQLRRLRSAWTQRLTESHFRRAPLCAEFERQATLGTAVSARESRVEVRTEKRLGLAGSPLFHTGVLLVIVAGTLRALFAVDAVVDLVEGETLLPTSEAWAAQWPGLLARPLRLDCPVTLDEVRATRYERGDLRDLRIRLSLRQGGGSKGEEVAINQALHVPGGRLFLGSDFGPAALIEWQENGTPSAREAVLLVSQGKGVYEGRSSGQAGVRAYLRAQVDGAGNRPTSLELRVMRGSALLFTGQVRPGDVAPISGGLVLRLHGMPFWARLRGSRDPALWLAYLGFALALVGATIIFTVVKVDSCVVVTTEGDHERVFVALRPQRFAAAFRERFQRLVDREGGPV
jgi:cytochrome c biogenesis protein